MGFNVGVIADSEFQLNELTRLVYATGHVVKVALESEVVLKGELPKVDVWLVGIDFASDVADPLTDLLDQLVVPVIYYDGELPNLEFSAEDSKTAEHPAVDPEAYLHDVKRLKNKLESLAIQSDVEISLGDKFRKAKEVWVLAASTGGPSAVAEFLDGIPNDLDGVAFLYVQHIEANAIKTLQQVVEQHSSWSVFDTENASVMQEKAIYIISPTTQVNISEDGTIRPTDVPWLGDYRPSIDQVIAQVASMYRNRGGAVVFTGMGDDGAKSCMLLRHLRGQVWVQSAQSCTIDSMPTSVEKKTAVDVSADPKDLARRFVAYHRAGAASFMQSSSSTNF